MGAIILIGIVLMIYGGAPTILERRRPYKVLLNLWQYLDISDKVWSLLEPHLPGQRGQWGGIAQDNRRFINGLVNILSKKFFL